MHFSSYILTAGLTVSTCAHPFAAFWPGWGVYSSYLPSPTPWTSSWALNATTSVAAAATATGMSVTKPVVTATGTTIEVVATTSSAAAVPTSSGFEWLGVNESGAEFGATSLPGILGKDYTWPNTSTIDIFISKGMNIFRIPILMERIVPTKMTGTVNATYLSGLTTVVKHITGKGASAVIDSQNFGRYYGEIFNSTADFKTYWKTVASHFASDSNVIFDCNNEFHDEPSNQLVVDLDQACIDGVRAAGATTQHIFVEGTSYTGAWTWVSSGNSAVMGTLTDPSDKIVYEMHQYLDSDGSGTSNDCVNNTIGADRIADATAWLKANKKLGIIGEYAAGNTTTCVEAVKGMLKSLSENTDVWKGAMWWGAGPWWGEYIYAMEPPSGTAFLQYLPLILPYAPASSS